MRRGALALVLAAAAVVPVLALEVPRLDRRVTDLAGLLSASAVDAMESELQRLEAETGAQVAVLTIPSLEGEPLEDYSLRVVEAWQLGREDRDNGVLVLIARDDRRIRIEVGYGLEGVLPDALCGRIIDHAMKPAFRQGDFSGGTRQAVEVIAAAVRGDPDAAAAVAAPEAAAPELGTMIAMTAVFLAVIGTFAMSALFTKGAAAWFLYFFLVPFFFAFPSAVLGARWGVVAALAWLVGFPILRALIWHTVAVRTFRTSYPTLTTWTATGGSWGRGGFGGGGGGGGFSGGGGSFGGGGASGGW
ncbi:MAG TPA: TPM domain-containing protein [Candidatus Sulfomarinibacteraceae bacterium]|nr:TPM domain-containing protein [Candidatus Sulfomarinibacteraceae bacterium]